MTKPAGRRRERLASAECQPFSSLISNSPLFAVSAVEVLHLKPWVMTSTQQAPVAVPIVRQVVLDCPDARVLAEFYRRLFGLEYRPGDEPPDGGEPDQHGQDWLVLRAPGGGFGLAFQQVPGLPEPTWPAGPRPQMLHLDTTVPTIADLRAQRERALALGARELLDRSDDDQEPLYVLADPAGHPFCIFVAD